jgi:uncharacterized protein (UPF0276 family)
MPAVPSAPAPPLGGFPRKLGVGFSYVPALSAEFYRPDLLDFIEITPEKLCRARWDAGLSLDLVPDKLRQAQIACGDLPILVHGIELSIGSAAGWNSGYLQMLDRFQEAWPFLWHSEHLSYQTIPGRNGGPASIGTPLPLPGSDEAAHLIGERAATVGHRYGVPFLLENPAHYLSNLPYEAGIGDEFGLMAAVTEYGGCGQLLDLHNLNCNALNHGFDAFAALDRIGLDRVIEIHLGGGRRDQGFWVDAHDSMVPDPVWRLLECALPRCPNISGVLFEVLDFFAPSVGAEAIADELRHVRTVWQRCCPAVRVAKA